jgi:RNA polymerase sigma-70 factor (ECF subfamily)
MPPNFQLKRVRQVIAQELTPCQKEILLAYYFQQKTLPQIAEERKVNKSTVCRTLQRAEARIRKYLKY